MQITPRKFTTLFFLQFFLIISIAFSLIARERQMELRIYPVENAHFYEIQWLAGKDDTNGSIEKMDSTVLKKGLSDEYTHFRLRSVGTDNNTSSWGQIVAIHDYVRKYFPFREVVMENGKTILFLIPDELDIALLTGLKEPLYSINGGNKNNYENPVLFNADGNYNLYVYDSRFSTTEVSQMFSFIVDHNPPASRVYFYPNFYFYQQRMWLKKEGYFEILVKDRETYYQVQSFYRVFPLAPQENTENSETKKGEFLAYSGKIMVENVTSPDEYLYQIEFYSMDIMGNKESIQSIIFGVDRE